MNKDSVQDNSILERRLRPIYDALDVRNPKKALQEADKVLKKSPNLQCARALKAIALLQLGRQEESSQILGALEQEEICDDATLQVMTFVYKETDQLTRICQMYQKAVSLTPNNEEILSHLFMSYVRVNDFKQQKDVALLLYRLNAKNPYYFWAVMSVFLQALRGADAGDVAKRRLLLMLAQKMIDKFIVEDKLDAEQEVQLYVEVLKEQGKFQEALDFLQGPIGTKLYPGAPVSLKLDLLKELNRWQEYNDLVKELLRADIDRWDYHKEFLYSSLELSKSGVMSAESIFESCHEFICHLIESSERPKRGPYLGRLELHRLMRDTATIDPVGVLGEYSQLLLEYFRNFGHCICCASDLILFMKHLTADAYRSFGDALLQAAPLSADGTGTETEVQKYICAIKVTLCLDTTDRSPDSRLSLADHLLRCYDVYRKKYAADLLPTDIGPCDQLAWLAAHILAEVGLQLQSGAHLLKALSVLAHLLTNSPSNFDAKLLSLKLYHVLGHEIGACEMFDSLDTKHVQMDSLGYLHCALLAPSFQVPPYTGRHHHLVQQSTLRFFTMAAKENAEYLTMSYRYGTFSKLQEFMDFRDRLTNSLHLHGVRVESALAEVATMTHVQGTGTTSFGLQHLKALNVNPARRTEYAALADNRDLLVMKSWTPTIVNDFDDAAIRAEKLRAGKAFVMEHSFKRNVILLRVRTTLLHLVVAQINAITGQVHHVPGPSATMEDAVELVRRLSAEWTEAFEEARQADRSYSEEYLVNVLLNQLHLVLQVPYRGTMDAMTAFTLALVAAETDLAAISGTADRLMAALQTLTETALQAIEANRTAPDPLWTYRMTSEKVVGCLEIVLLSALIVSCAAKRLNKTQGGGKKAKKNELPAKERDTVNVVAAVMKCVKDQLTAFLALLVSWKSPDVSTTTSSDLMDRLKAMCLTDEQKSADEELSSFLDHDRIKFAHDSAMHELCAVIKERLKFVSRA